jgi:phosphoribosyl-AMP cyclohydrolase / phosphoribosyl-ATP pyrophosphohydrolase
MFEHPSIYQIDFYKGLVPVIIQNFYTKKVIMLGYMNINAYQDSICKGYVTFYSRSKNRLWTKGENSGNNLLIKKILIDCDSDTILIIVVPYGKICHTGNVTCWNEVHENEEIKDEEYNFLLILENIIFYKIKTFIEKSYLYRLVNKGINRIVQKFGEESVEIIIESKDNKSEYFLNEAADLFFHYIILIHAKNHFFYEVLKILENRNNLLSSTY